jgi:hypothetical protein
MSTPAEAYYDVTPRSAEMGVGTVVGASATTLTLLVRGAGVEAAFLDSYSPTVGDLVMFLRQDSTWVVPGKYAGVGSNEVLNFNFEDDDASPSTPSHWTLYNVSGSGTASTTSAVSAPAGDFELSVAAGSGAQDTYVYSDPIIVNPGEQWAISALASAVYPPAAAPSADAAVYAFWFANTTNLYPSTAAADTLVAQVNDVGPAPDHSSVSGTVTVPGGVAVMRVALRSITAGDIAMLFDVVIARKIG